MAITTNKAAGLATLFDKYIDTVLNVHGIDVKWNTLSQPLKQRLIDIANISNNRDDALAKIRIEVYKWVELRLIGSLNSSISDDLNPSNMGCE